MPHLQPHQLLCHTLPALVLLTSLLAQAPCYPALLQPQPPAKVLPAQWV
jgi:hypothetical protein